MAHSTGHRLSAFFAPRFGRPFIKRVVARQRRRTGEQEAQEQALCERLNHLAKEPTGFKWYETDITMNFAQARAAWNTLANEVDAAALHAHRVARDPQPINTENVTVMQARLTELQRQLDRLLRGLS